MVALHLFGHAMVLQKLLFLLVSRIHSSAILSLLRACRHFVLGCRAGARCRITRAVAAVLMRAVRGSIVVGDGRRLACLHVAVARHDGALGCGPSCLPCRHLHLDLLQMHSAAVDRARKCGRTDTI